MDLLEVREGDLRMIINVRTPLAANGVANVLQGATFETITEPSLVQIGVCADATGVVAGITSGPDTMLEADSPISVKTINTLPVFPDDFFEDEAMPLDKLAVRVRDTSGVARVVMTQVRITPL